MKMHDFGEQVEINLETTNDVARKATKEDLVKIWKLLGAPHADRRVLIDLRTPVAGVNPWGRIWRYKPLGESEWKMETMISSLGIDQEPYEFVKEIDRRAKNQQCMIVTLPIVNRLESEFDRRGFQIKRPDVDFFQARRDTPRGSMTVTLTPEHFHVVGMQTSQVEFHEAVQMTMGQFGIADQVKEKLDAAMHSAEYQAVTYDRSEPAHWKWRFGEIDVLFIRFAGQDDLDAEYAQ